MGQTIRRLFEPPSSAATSIAEDDDDDNNNNNNSNNNNGKETQESLSSGELDEQDGERSRTFFSPAWHR